MRWSLDLKDAEILSMFADRGLAVDGAVLSSWFLRDDEEGFALMPNIALNSMLDALIVRERGEKPGSAGKVPSRTAIDNNSVLKKLKIAFALRDTDIETIMTLGGAKTTISQFSAFFRNPEHRNYRPCMDQYLKAFLTGLKPFLEKRERLKD